MSDFVAWTRTGWTTRGTGPGTALSDASLHIALEVDGGPSGLSVPLRGRIAGPGDIVALGAGAVRRIVPTEGSSDLPESRLSFVEFASADMPWAVSPDSTTPQPWLALVVLPASDATFRTTMGPEILTCTTDLLPDVADLHSFAHAQGEVSRVIAPRQLESGKRYVAALVPTFEQGRRAGLNAAGEDTSGLSSASLTDPAWVVDGTSIELPVYLRWSFTTGDPLRLAERVDALARGDALELGWRRISAASPGLDITTDGGTWFAPGALAPPDSEPTSLVDETTIQALRTAIDAVLDRDDASTADVPTLGPPVRGARLFGAETTVDWCADLNLDPRWRVISGVGEAMVRQLQEDLVRDIQDGVPSDLVRRDADRSELKATTIEAVLGTSPRLHPSFGFLLARTSNPHAAHEHYSTVVGDPSLRRALRPGAALVRQVSRGVGHTVGTVAHVYSAAFQSTKVLGRRDSFLRGVGIELGTSLSSLAGVGPVPEQEWPPPPPRPSVPRYLGPAPSSLDDARRAAVVALGDALDELATRHAAVEAGRQSTAEGLDRALVDSLARYDAEWLLPGIGNLPGECVVVLEPQAAFAESLLIGVNEEILRELMWREVTHDQSTAYAPCFWQPGVVDLDTTDDWSTGSLGSHMDASATWVLVRSTLWRSCPDLALVAFPSQVGTTGELEPKSGGSWVLPDQELQLSDDLVLVAFSLSADELMGSDTEDGHYLVFTEPDSGAAFKNLTGEVAGLLTSTQDGATEAHSRLDQPDEAWVHASRFKATE